MSPLGRRGSAHALGGAALAAMGRVEEGRALMVQAEEELEGRLSEDNATRVRIRSYLEGAGG